MDAAAIAAVVYVIDADQGVKIGITRFADVGGRRRDLERAAGQPFRVLRTLAGDRTIGEWFHTHPLEACSTIDRLVAHGNAAALRIRMSIEAAAA